MNFCFISGFSQPASILKKLGESLKLDGERLYLSSSELVGQKSYIDNLHEKLKDQNNIVLIGWSLGGSIALEYAARFKVSALVIISGTACYVKNESNSSGIEPVRVEALIKGVTQSKEQSLRRFITSVCSPMDGQTEFENCYKNALNVSSYILVHNLEYFKKDFRSLCSKIQCPTLIMHDQDDRVVPFAQGELLAELIKQSKKYFTSGFGHLIINKQPELLAREIEKLFRINKANSVESSFSKSANSYDDYSEVQRQIADQLLSLIPDYLKPKQIIDLGTGTGYLAKKLDENYTNTELTLCDISSEMLNIASSKIKNAKLLCCNFEELATKKIDKFDLIASSAALHWASSFETLSKTLTEISTDDSFFAISIMLEGTLHELRSLRLEIAPNKKPHPELRSFDYYKNIINRDNDIIAQSEQTYTLYYSSPEQVIEALRKTGVNGGSSEKLTKEEYSKLIQKYTDKYKTNKGYPITFKAGFLITKKHRNSPSPQI